MAVRQALLVVAGAAIVLTSSPVVVAVEPVRVVARPAVLEEEDLRGPLGAEVLASLSPATAADGSEARHRTATAAAAATTVSSDTHSGFIDSPSSFVRLVLLKSFR